LLRNRAYLGERIYNTTRRASLSEKKTRRVKNSPDHYVIVKDSHPAIISQELFDHAQTILDNKRPKIGQRKHSPRDYILSGLLWCKEHHCAYSGHTTGSACYYACGERKKLGKKHAACAWLKKEAMEQFVLSNLKANVFTRDIIHKGLELLLEEQARNKQEDYTEEVELTKQKSQADLELSRLEDATKKGIDPEAFSKSINELLVLKRRLQHRLDEIEIERQRALKLPAVTETMVDAVLDQVHSMIDTTDPQELKTALSHFIEKMEVTGSEITIFYSVAPPKKAIVPTNGDPGGI
jgi:site-specific DNA recombinase